MVWSINAWVALIALGLSLRIGLRYFYGARGPEKGDALYAFVNIVSWVLLLLALLPPVLVAGVTYIGAILLIFAALTFVEAVIQRRAAQRRSMCKLLALSMGRGVQLGPSILLAGQSFCGKVGRECRALADELNFGTPFVAAVRRYPQALPPEAIAYIAAGPTNEARAAALDELSRSDRGPLTAVWRTFLDRLTYLLCVLFVMVLIITFVLIWIAPQFENIFAEFGLELPRPTLMVLAFSKFVVRYVAAPMAVLLGVLSIAAFVIAVYYLVDRPIMRPITDRLLRGRRRGDVLRILAVAADARQPLAPVLERLGNVYPSGLVRLRLARASAAVTAGGGWRQALRDARIVNQAEQALLATAEKVGNLPWALREIAQRGEKRATYRLAAAVQVLYPCAVLVLAAFIGFFVVGMFLPLINLIKSLA